MRDSNLKRRDFHKLTMAAMGGMVAGSATGGTVFAQRGEQRKGKLTMEPALLAKEPHICRGLNTCQGKGASGQNACAGQGACANVAKHACAGQNACKGQGGCHGYPGQNTCKGKGHCAVPLKKKTGALARTQFEEVMKDLGRKVGPAPSA